MTSLLTQRWVYDGIIYRVNRANIQIYHRTKDIEMNDGIPFDILIFMNMIDVVIKMNC